eukprot:COSAG02_NODE_4813_length_4949_cov_2.146598_5_plen_159_part_00
MTAVVACCTCGGGDRPLIQQADCMAAVKSCEVVDACRRSKANKVLGVMTVLVLVAVGFCVKCVKKKFNQTADPVEQQASIEEGVVGPSDSHAAKKRARRKRKKRKDATNDPVAVTVQQQASIEEGVVGPSDSHAAKKRARRKRKKRKGDSAAITVEQC